MTIPRYTSTTPSLDAKCDVVSCLHRLNRLWQASTGRPRSRWNTREALSRKCHPSLNTLGCDMLRLISKPIKEFQPFWGNVKGWNMMKLMKTQVVVSVQDPTQTNSCHFPKNWSCTNLISTNTIPLPVLLGNDGFPQNTITLDMLIQHLQPRLNQLPQLPHDYSSTWISSQSVLENRMLAAKVPSRSSKISRLL